MSTKPAVRPQSDLGNDLGKSDFRWNALYVDTVDVATALSVAGTDISTKLSSIDSALDALIGEDFSQFTADLLALQTSVSTLQGQVSTLTGDVDALEGEDATNDQKIASLEAQVASILVSVAEVEGDVTTLNNGLSAVSATLASEQTKLANLLTDIGSFSFSGTASAVTALQASVASLQSGLANATTDIATNATSIGTVSSNLSALTTTVSSNKTSTDASIASLQTSVASNTTAIGTNSTAIASSVSDLTALTTRVNTTESDISSNSASISSLTSSVATNTADIVTNSNSITALSTSSSSAIASLTAQQSTNTTGIATNASGITANATAIASNTSDIVANSNLISSLSGSIATNTASIATANASIATNASDIANVTSSVSSKLDVASFESRTLSAGVGLTGGGDLSADRSFSLASIGTAQTNVGSSSAIPVLSIDEYGRVTALSSTAVSIPLSTDDLTEGSNLFFTEARTRSALSAGGDLSYDSATGEFSINVGSVSINLSDKTSDDLTEGSTNLYFTDSRARGSISASGSLAYDQSTGVVSFTERSDATVQALALSVVASADTDTISEGSTNLYYTDARARNALSASGSLISYDAGTGVLSSVTPNSDAISEGTSNLYFTEQRSRSAISVSGDLAYDSSTGVLSSTAYSGFDSDFASKTTDALAEGSANLYHTDARVRSALSAGDGVSFDSSTGTISASLLDADALGTSTAQAPTQRSVKSYVDSQIESITGENVPQALDTLKEIADAISDNDSDIATILTTQSSKADKSIAVTAGGALSGGGDLSTDFSISLDSLHANALSFTGSKVSVPSVSVDVYGRVTALSSSSVSFTTDDVAQGSNLYYTDSLARSAVSVSGSLSYDSSTGVISFIERSNAQVEALASSVFTSRFSVLSTSDLPEGSALYFTDARARLAISATGDLSYNNATGVLSYSQRSDAQVRSLFSASNDLSYDSSTGTFSVTTYNSFDSDFGAKLTDDLVEGSTNLYFSNARVEAYLPSSSHLSSTYVSNSALATTLSAYATDADLASEISDVYDALNAMTESSLSGAIISSVGLASDGTFSADSTGEYISGATSVRNEIELLDTAVKSNEDSIASNASSIATAQSNIADLESDVSSLQTEIDLVQTSTGLGTDGSLPSFGSVPVIGGSSPATSIKDALHKLGDYLGEESLTGSLSANVVSALASISNLLSAVTSNDSDISDLDSRLTTAESDISDVEASSATNATAIAGLSSDIASLTTDDIAEGASLYYTDSRARSALSADGDLAYDSSTGVVSYQSEWSTANGVSANANAIKVNGYVLEVFDMGALSDSPDMTLDAGSINDSLIYREVDAGSLNVERLF